MVSHGGLGYLDHKEHVILSGRLKRFAKIGGEMISLGALEEILLDALLEKWGKLPMNHVLPF